MYVVFDGLDYLGKIWIFLEKNFVFYVKRFLGKKNIVVFKI